MLQFVAMQIFYWQLPILVQCKLIFPDLLNFYNFWNDNIISLVALSSYVVEMNEILIIHHAKATTQSRSIFFYRQITWIRMESLHARPVICDTRYSGMKYWLHVRLYNCNQFSWSIFMHLGPKKINHSSINKSDPRLHQKHAFVLVDINFSETLIFT